MVENILELMNETHISPTKLHRLIETMNEVDIADAFELLSREKAIQMFRLLPKDMAADVFSHIAPEKQQVIIEALTDIEIGKVIEDLFADDAVDFIEEMPANIVKRVLKNVSEDTRQTINQLLQYPEDSAGTIMTTEYVDLKEDMTVGDAFIKIRTTGVDKETIYTCYVLRYDRVLVGAISARTLLLASPGDRIGDIMDGNIFFAHTTDDQETVADLFKKYGLLSMPIVDKEQRLVGIVTVDDIVQIIEEEATEDFEKMAALSPSEEPYLKTKILTLSKNRIKWLIFLMLSSTITASIISSYEDALASAVALVAFIPMLMNTSGNAGSQTSVLVIRGMALGEIQIKDILRVLWREVRVGVICGIILGAVNFIRVYFTGERDPLLSLTVTLALIITVVLAKSVGAILPIAAKKVRIDPTVMAAPLLTTIVDATALMIYFSIARVIMKI